MSIHIQIPADIERELRGRLGDLDGAAKEAMLVELYRCGHLTHAQLCEALGLERSATDAILKRHGAMIELGPQEFADELAHLRGLMAP